eukprot:3589529-Prorocentrum_lima.AAC.1
MSASYSVSTFSPRRLQKGLSFLQTTFTSGDGGGSATNIATSAPIVGGFLLAVAGKHGGVPASALTGTP